MSISETCYSNRLLGYDTNIYSASATHVAVQTKRCQMPSDKWEVGHTLLATDHCLLSKARTEYEHFSRPLHPIGGQQG